MPLTYAIKAGIVRQVAKQKTVHDASYEHAGTSNCQQTRKHQNGVGFSESSKEAAEQCTSILDYLCPRDAGDTEICFVLTPFLSAPTYSTVV